MAGRSKGRHVILLALLHRQRHVADDRPQQEALIREVLEHLRSEGVVTVGGLDYETAGEVAVFAFADRRPAGDDAWPDATLTIAVNTTTGYGGLVWSGTVLDADTDTPIHQRWLSSNPQPPGFDPRVVMDPHIPMFHDPDTTLPAARIREALEEYCRTGTGERPQCIDWVPRDWGML